MDKHFDLSTEETYFTSKNGDLARNHGKTRLEQSQKQMQKTLGNWRMRKTSSFTAILVAQ
jgi:hypothetical protein